MPIEFPRLQRVSERLDDYLRFGDFNAHRTAGGRLDRWCGITRHAPLAILLPAIVSSLAVLGSPSWTRAALALATGIAAAFVLVVVMRMSERRGWSLRADVLCQSAVVAVTCTGVWVLGSDTYRPSGVYRHLFVPVAVMLCVALVVASHLARRIFAGVRVQSCYGAYLQKTELFASRGPAPAVTPGTVLTAFVMAFIRAPLALLTIPAIATLLSAPVWIPVVPLGVFAICFIALVIAGVNERFGVMWNFALSALFTGVAAPVSLLIIALAILRLMGLTYVTTVFDTVAWRTVGVTLFGVYVLAWWYDYWANRLVTDQVLAMLDPTAEGGAVIAYPIQEPFRATSVPVLGRQLQVHGAARLLALNESDAAHVRFQSHLAWDVLDLLATAGAPGGKAVPTPMQVHARIGNFHAVSAVMVLALVLGSAWLISAGPQLAEATIARTDHPGLSLADLLDRAPSAPDRPLLLVAASGGGTRAAVYAAAVFEGLARVGRAGDILLASGVSGGGAAMAYFAANRAALLNAPGGSATWDRYLEVVAEPYIQDVLDRASEIRMVRGGRLGILLAHSFETRWQLPADRRYLSQIDDLGIIFNTSLAGHFERPASAPPGRLVDIEPSYRKQTKSTLAGGRLLLTNLALPNALQQRLLEPDVKIPLPVIIRRDDLRLEEAAALNANFPPVFSNAAIDVDDRMRYWVTDGGAVDNRGLEMLLYAVRLALDDRRHQGKALPPLHVIVVDASAYSDGYTQDRGVGSATGAGTRFASHLNAELAASIRERYRDQPEKFAVSYLMMPNILRESGSFGTHWMLQRSIRVRGPGEGKKISGAEMIRVLRALHTTSDGSQLTADGCSVLAWSQLDTAYQQGWAGLLKTIGTTNPPLNCPSS